MTSVIRFVTLAVLCLSVTSSGIAEMQGIVGVWLFDEGSGDTAADASGNGHDGTLVGSADWDSDGVFGSAIVTDGSEAYVEVPDDPALEFDGDFSIVCWVQNETPPSDHSAFVTKGYHRPSGQGGDARPWYLVYYLTTGTVDMFLRDTGGVNSRASGQTPINDGQWHHLVAMKVDDEVKLYVDGVEDASAPAVDAKYGENDQPLVFMVHFDRFFAGKIDEVGLFNRALTDQEIQVIMEGGLARNALSVEAKGKLAVSWGDLKQY